MKNLKHFVKNKFISNHYLLSKISFHFWHSLKLLGHQPIVIYQMGKVGSTSILYSLQNIYKDYPIYQVHVLSERGIVNMEKKYWGDTPVLLRKSLLPETEHLYTSHFIRYRMKKSNKNERWKIITLVRDPISRNVSEFFYSVDTTKSKPYLPNFYSQINSNTIETIDIIEAFKSCFREGSEDYILPLNWFDDEFRNVLNVDVYSREFPQKQGYQIIQTESYDLLILKLEMLKKCSQNAFREFLGIENFDLVTANIAEQKKYYPVYKKFLGNVSLPESYVNGVYASKYMKHFYTAEEIQVLRCKWCH